MQTSNGPILDIFTKATILYHAPIYQRRYSWRQKQCTRLVEDILECFNLNRKHFIGVLVLQEHNKDDFMEDITDLDIIDGQQRTTSLYLLLLALARFIDEANYIIKEPRDSISSSKIKSRYLINKDIEHGEGFFKLHLTNKDNEILHSLVESHSVSEREDLKNHKIISNYNHFYRILKDGYSCDTEFISKIYSGLKRIYYLGLKLDIEDDPQVIFECLNSTGEKLSQSDLIKNFLLMNVKDRVKQTSLASKYWDKIEDNLDNITFPNKLENELSSKVTTFIRDFMTASSGIYPKENEVYVEFRNKYRNKDLNYKFLESELRELLEYSSLYEKIRKCEGEDNQNILRCFRRFKDLNLTVTYPLILRVYRDFTHKKITDKEFIDLLSLLESYIIRRFVCNLPTNKINLVLPKIILALNRNPDCFNDTYILCFTDELCKQQGESAFPSDLEFKANLNIFRLYSSKIKRFVEFSLENHLNQDEPISWDNRKSFDVEHIMPQTLTDDWRKLLGDNCEYIYDTYLDTIGNLTLISRKSNKTLSNKTPYDKFVGIQDSSYTHSKLKQNRLLIEDFYKKTATVWGEDEIKKRASFLIKICLEIWGKPPSLHTKVSDNLLFEDNWTSISNIDLVTDTGILTFNTITDISNHILNNIILKTDDVDIGDILEVSKENSLDITLDSTTKLLKFNGSLNNNYKRDYLIELLHYVNIEPNTIQLIRHK